MNIGIDCGDDAYSAVTFAKMDGDVAVILATLTGEPADAFIALLRVARAAKILDEYVELPEETTEWTNKYRWCPHCGYKSPDGHWKDCEALALQEALKEVEHLL